MISVITEKRGINETVQYVSYLVPRYCVGSRNFFLIYRDFKGYFVISRNSKNYEIVDSILWTFRKISENSRFFKFI